MDLAGGVAGDARGGFRDLVVCDDGKVVGTVSAGDLLRAATLTSGSTAT
ncbi:hypothetical protein R8Z50_22295 [Longispora sp. K20-0274]